MKKTKTPEREYHYYIVRIARGRKLFRVPTTLQDVFEQAVIGAILAEGTSINEVYQQLDKEGS